MNDQNLFELCTLGYTKIKVFDKKTAHEFRDRFTNWREDRDLDHIHGIIKSYGIGQTDFMWDIRCHDNVFNVFKTIWQTDDLLVSFDGAGYYPANDKKRPSPSNWAHRDQAGFRKGRQTIQSVIYLEDAKNRNDGHFVCVPGSHLEQYESTGDFARVEGIKPEDWNHCLGGAGTMVLWDSRTIHANQAPTSGGLDRSVAYVCMMPNVASQSILNKRAKYFSENRTTNHHPVRVTVNPDCLIRFHKGLNPKEVMLTLPSKSYISERQMALVKGKKNCDFWKEHEELSEGEHQTLNSFIYNI